MTYQGRIGTVRFEMIYSEIFLVLRTKSGNISNFCFQVYFLWKKKKPAPSENEVSLRKTSTRLIIYIHVSIYVDIYISINIILPHPGLFRHGHKWR